jgi:hypothetical protein
LDAYRRGEARSFRDAEDLIKELNSWSLPELTFLKMIF